MKSSPPTAVVVLAVSTTLASCASRPIEPASTQTVVAVPAGANCSYSAEFPEGKNCCIMDPYLAKVDVDGAYARAVDEFHFSEQARPFELEGEAYAGSFHRHMHVAKPTVGYQLQGIVVPQNDPELYRGLWLSLTLIAAEGGRTRVEPTYCEPAGRAMVDQRRWHGAVQASIRQALPSP